jgi:hypothetical protein
MRATSPTACLPRPGALGVRSERPPCRPGEVTRPAGALPPGSGSTWGARTKQAMPGDARPRRDLAAGRRPGAVGALRAAAAAADGHAPLQAQIDRLAQLACISLTELPAITPAARGACAVRADRP